MELMPVLICFILLLLNIPVALSMIVASFVYFLFLTTGLPSHLVMQRLVTANMSYTLLAVPFFVTIGVVMNYSGISSRMMKFCDTLTGHLNGGLAYVNILLSTLLGGISGSASADAAMQSKILVPEMEKAGFDRAFSASITAASSLISPIIPPGVALILYATLTNSSVGKMFIAGYIPGLLISAIFFVIVAIISKKENYKPSRESRASIMEIWDSFKQCFWALCIPILIIVGLRSGLFTPTEAGAVIIVLCLFIGFFVYKELKIEHLKPMLLEAVVAISSIMLVIVAANVFGFYLSWERIPQYLTGLIVNFTSNKLVFLLLVNILLLFMGMFLEGTALLLIVTPLLYPTAIQLGIDPIHFGLILICNLAVGGISPPFGSIMYLTCSITKVSILDFLKKGWPFILALILSVFIITYSPKLMLFLPELLY